MTGDSPQSILSHLVELRSRLIKVAAAIVIGSIIALIFDDFLIEILNRPYFEARPDGSLQALEPGEEFGVLMRVGLFGGIMLASPIILYHLWAFVAPALTKREKKWVIPIVSSFVVLFAGGVLFGYTLLPRALDALLGIFEGVSNDLLIGPYYSFVLRLLLAFGITFQLPIFLFALAAAGVVNSAQLAHWRRWAILLIVIAAAAVTPTGDPLTLALLAVPLYVLYELTLLLVRFTLRR
ncbi:MAG: twin-arginine translocase subunit TatC [Acidimicrobiia bacterium]|nr:twin-arginine translocase subunit TatC [Acidimicrobiia bacterium]MDQ3501497.1 twin-arginine translocase subunit TatC [Actinomycetota bacterium]